MRRAAALAVACLALVPALADSRTKPFTPRQVAGTWTGSWSNQTFGTSGTLTLSGRTLKHGRAFRFDVDLGGNALGCPDPAAERTPTIKKGSGDNRWNRKGFQLHLVSPAYGAFLVTYSARTHKLTGGGGKPACAPAVTWKLNGRLTRASFTGSIAIDLGNGQTASSTLTATRH